MSDSDNDRWPARPSAPQRPMPGWTRRRMLGSAGLAGVVAFAGACGIKPAGEGTGTSQPGPTGSADADTSQSAASGTDDEKIVYWSNGPEYIDADSSNSGDHPSIDEFTKETGIKVVYTEDINSNQDYFAKIQPVLSAGQPIAADMFMFTDWMAAQVIRLGFIAELDQTHIPNLKNLNPELANVGFDPGRHLSVPWQSGITGIAYNAKATGGKAITSMTQLLTDPALKGRVALLTEMRDTMGLTMLDMGADPTDFTDTQFDAAITMLQSAVKSGQIRSFTGNDYAQGLVSGDIAACTAWTGDIVQLQIDNADLKYVLPDKGVMLWSDNLMIPKGAKHKKNAELLMNFYYQPEIAAQVADYINYITPVAGSKEILLTKDPDVANNPLIFPPDDVMKRAHVFMTLTEDQADRYDKAFAGLMGA
ncbi:MAG: extracellular solute-binding protein [Nakamurella sp.]